MAWYLPDRYPVFWEEVRRRMVGRLLRLSQPVDESMSWMKTLIYATPWVLGIIELLLVLTPLLSPDHNAYNVDFWKDLMQAQNYLTVLLAPGLAVSIFTLERERGSLDFLFLLPISTRSLILQKFTSACLLPLSVVVYLLPYYIVLAVLGHPSSREVFLGYLFLLAHGAFYVALALMISSLTRNTRTAAIITYVVIFLLEYLLPQWYAATILSQFGVDGVNINALFTGQLAAFMNALLTGPLTMLIPIIAYLLLTPLVLWISTAILQRQRAPNDGGGAARQYVRQVGLPNLLRWYLPDKHPVLWDDLRRRLRGGRAINVLLGFVLVLCVILVVVFTSNAPGNDPHAWPRLGRELFDSIMEGQAVMVCLLSPALTATTFSSERESRRLDFLFLTGLTTRELVYGKYFGAVAVLLLALISGAPLLAIIAATFGGISPGELALGYAVVICCGLFGTTTALFASCQVQNSSKALTQGYLTTIGLGVTILYGVMQMFNYNLLLPAILIIALGSILMCLKKAVKNLEKERQLIREEMLPSLSTDV